MSSKANHKKRSRKTHGTPVFKSKDMAKHGDIFGFPVFKKHVKKY